MISTKWLAYQFKDETDFLMIFRPHMSIWFSTNVKILMFIKWSYPPPSASNYNMLTIELRMDIMFWTHNPMSFKTHILFAFVLKLTPNHIPLNCRCVIKKSNQQRVVYLYGKYYLLKHGNLLFLFIFIFIKHSTGEQRVFVGHRFSTHLW